MNTRNSWKSSSYNAGPVQEDLQLKPTRSLKPFGKMMIFYLEGGGTMGDGAEEDPEPQGGGDNDGEENDHPVE